MKLLFVFCLLSVAFADDPASSSCQMLCCYGATCVRERGRETCKCLQICSAGGKQVCGSDFKNYTNECALNVAHCKSNGTVTAIPNRFCGLPEPCNETTNCVGGYCIGSGDSSVCRQFVNEGGDCDGSLPPQKLCKEPLLCVLRANRPLRVAGIGKCTRQAPKISALAILEPNDPAATDVPLVSGTVTLSQDGVEKPVVITAKIVGLPTGTYGFHIHTSGNTTFVNGSGRCNSTGAHYNPFNMTHGLRTNAVRHVGDLGNFHSTDSLAEFTISDRVVTLYGPTSVLGRAFVVHAMSDDGGQTMTGTSNTTGNAGARRACGPIVLVA